MGTPALWIAFNVAVFLMVGLDLLLAHRKGGVISAKAAGAWTLVWIGLSLAFAGFIYARGGLDAVIPFLTGYVVEYALSVDNLFVFLMVFGYFKVQPRSQHRLLYWGILGAFAMRASLILLGTALVSRFHWLLYIFGGFLIFTAWKMLFSKEDAEADPEKNFVLHWARKVLPVAKGDTGDRFLVRQEGKWLVTPLFLVLLVVETTDLLFAVDSIPAVLGITQDPYLVYTSNVCAILGLRSLFFVVAKLMDKFHYLKVGLAIVLAFVGLKMVLETYFGLGESFKTQIILGSLTFIALTLAVSILWSVLRPPSSTHEASKS